MYRVIGRALRPVQADGAAMGAATHKEE